jgi:hypothetical protein
MEIDQEQVGLCLLNRLKGGHQIRRFSDHLCVLLAVEQRAQSSTYQPERIGENYVD